MLLCSGGAYQLGTGALFGDPTTGGGAQIIGGGAGLRPNLTPAAAWLTGVGYYMKNTGETRADR